MSQITHLNFRKELKISAMLQPIWALTTPFSRRNASKYNKVQQSLQPRKIIWLWLTKSSWWSFYRPSKSLMPRNKTKPKVLNRSTPRKLWKKLLETHYFWPLKPFSHFRPTHHQALKNQVSQIKTQVDKIPSQNPKFFHSPSQRLNQSRRTQFSPHQYFLHQHQLWRIIQNIHRYIIWIKI